MVKIRISTRMILAICVLTLCACAAQKNQLEASTWVEQSATHKTSNYAKEQDEIEKNWGIRVVSIRLAAANYMLDFRYHVSNVEKASAILTRKIKPHVIVEQTGRKLTVPVSAKLGPLRNSPKFIKPNRNYFAYFANPGRAVKSGDKVTVVMGDAIMKHIVVE